MATSRLVGVPETVTPALPDTWILAGFVAMGTVAPSLGLVISTKTLACSASLAKEML